jgi:hypothetical protein
MDNKAEKQGFLSAAGPIFPPRLFHRILHRADRKRGLLIMNLRATAGRAPITRREFRTSRSAFRALGVLVPVRGNRTGDGEILELANHRFREFGVEMHVAIENFGAQYAPASVNER